MGEDVLVGNSYRKKLHWIRIGRKAVRRCIMYKQLICDQTRKILTQQKSVPGGNYISDKLAALQRLFHGNCCSIFANGSKSKSGVSCFFAYNAAA